MKRLVAVLVLFGLMGAPAYLHAAIAQGEITPDDLAAADAERRAVGRELAGVLGEYDAAAVRSAELSADLAQLVTELAAREQELEIIRTQAEAVARQLYMSRGDSGLLLLLDSESINEYPVRQGYLRYVSKSDAATLSRLEAVKGSYADQQSRLDEAITEQSAVERQLEELSNEILGRLQAADEAYNSLVAAYEAQEAEKARLEEERRRREEEERRRRNSTTTTEAPDDDGGDETTTTVADDGGDDGGDDTTTTTTEPPSEPPPDGDMTCPVAGATTFVDSFGAPRSGGRAHMGVDMMAARGTPLVAIENATVASLGNGGLGGITVWIRGASGDTYYYAHLDAWESGLGVGDRLSMGDRLGYVGNTGNAVYTSPHLHFERHPGGGGAVNPYPLVRGLCL